MERAGRLLGKSRIRAMDAFGLEPFHLAPGAWAAATGKIVAAHTRPVFLDRDKLIVEVEDAVWKMQLESLSSAILTQLENVLGPGVVTRIEFRVAPPRRPPQREQSPALHRHVEGDESDRILDPVFRRIYRAARRRAQS